MRRTIRRRSFKVWFNRWTRGWYWCERPDSPHRSGSDDITEGSGYSGRLDAYVAIERELERRKAPKPEKQAV